MKPETSTLARIASLRLLVLLGLVCFLNSCVPLAIGAAGVAAGYIARDEKFGLSPEAENDSSPVSYTDSPAPAYESFPAESNASPVNPAYNTAPLYSDDVNMPVY